MRYLGFGDIQVGIRGELGGKVVTQERSFVDNHLKEIIKNHEKRINHHRTGDVGNTMANQLSKGELSARIMQCIMQSIVAFIVLRL